MGEYFITAFFPKAVYINFFLLIFITISILLKEKGIFRVKPYRAIFLIPSVIVVLSCIRSGTFPKTTLYYVLFSILLTIYNSGNNDGGVEYVLRWCYRISFLYLISVIITWSFPSIIEYFRRFYNPEVFEYTSGLLVYGTGEYGGGILTYTGADSIACIFVLGGIISQWDNKKFIEKIIGIALVVLVVFIMGNRSFTVALICSAIMMIYLIGKYEFNINRRVKYILLGSLILVILVTVVINSGVLEKFPLYNRLMYTLLNISRGTDFTTGRTYLHQVAVEMIRRKPFGGFGWGKYAVFGGNYAHNIYLQLSVENGIIGTILFCFPFLIVFLCTYKSLKRRLINKSCTASPLEICLFYQIFFIIRNFFENDIYIMTHFSPYIFICCFALCYYDE